MNQQLKGNLLEKYRKNWKHLKDKYHSTCLFNTHKHFDLQVEFTSKGELNGSFQCRENFQGYDGLMHGGVLSALIDSAMAQCLFGHGLVGVTARLNLKYIHPVRINKKLLLNVQIIQKDNHPVIGLNASIQQEGHKKVSADAKFWITRTEPVEQII